MAAPVLPPPRLLKDFLQDPPTTITTTSRLHKATELFINAVKFQFPFRATLSRRLYSRKTTSYVVKDVSTTVKVKDILRWKSFRDLAVAPPSPSHCTTLTTTSSGRSSWCDTEDLPSSSSSWCAECESDRVLAMAADHDQIELQVKKCLPPGGCDSVQTTSIATEEEEESHTPVSVLDFSFQELEDGNSISSLHPTFSKTRRRRVTAPNKRSVIGAFEVQDELLENPINIAGDREANAIEERASEIVEELVKETCLVGGYDYRLLLDFFRYELIANGDPKFDSEMLRGAKAWLIGEDEDGLLGWEMEGNREVCVREMDRRERWNKFDQEQEEMAMEIEAEMLNSLLDEILLHLLHH